MKRYLALVLIVAALPVLAVTVTNYITDSLGNPLSTRVVITPYTPSTVFGSTNVLGPSVGVSCTNGAWSAALLSGWYLVDQGNGTPKIPIFTTSGDGQTNGLAFFAALATNPIPTFGYTGTNVGDTVYVTNLWVTNLTVQYITYAGNTNNTYPDEYATLSTTDAAYHILWNKTVPTNNSMTIDFIIGGVASQEAQMWRLKAISYQNAGDTPVNTLASDGSGTGITDAAFSYGVTGGVFRVVVRGPTAALTTNVNWFLRGSCKTMAIPE